MAAKMTELSSIRLLVIELREELKDSSVRLVSQNSIEDLNFRIAESHSK
jgi:hypothetical protein